MPDLYNDLPERLRRVTLRPDLRAGELSVFRAVCALADDPAFVAMIAAHLAEQDSRGGGLVPEAVSTILHRVGRRLAVALRVALARQAAAVQAWRQDVLTSAHGGDNADLR